MPIQAKVETDSVFNAFLDALARSLTHDEDAYHRYPELISDLRRSSLEIAEIGSEIAYAPKLGQSRWRIEFSSRVQEFLKSHPQASTLLEKRTDEIVAKYGRVLKQSPREIYSHIIAGSSVATQVTLLLVRDENPMHLLYQCSCEVIEDLTGKSMSELAELMTILAEEELSHQTIN